MPEKVFIPSRLTDSLASVFIQVLVADGWLQSRFDLPGWLTPWSPSYESSIPLTLQTCRFLTSTVPSCHSEAFSHHYRQTR